MTTFDNNGKIQLTSLVWWNDMIRDEHGNKVPVTFSTKFFAITHFLLENCH